MFSWLWLSLSFALLSCTHAQYFSEGWKPGQAVTQEPASATPAAHLAQTQSQNTKSSQDSDPFLVKLLSSSPLGNFINTSTIASLAFAAGLTTRPNTYPWDARIPLITDLNYDEVIVKEEMTEEEERNRTWIIVVSASATSQHGGISQFVDQVFDDTYNETLFAGDMPHLRFGRIDYLNVTYLTTKWCVWQAPTFVILQNRGQTLRFVKPQWLRLRDGALREFLTTETYNEVPVWDTSFAPGGSNERAVHMFSMLLASIYNVAVKIPRWLMYILSGSVASFMIQILHRPSSSKNTKTANVADTSKRTSTASETQSQEKAAASGSESGQVRGGGGKAKQRKSKK